jgi:hypothetical protein
MGHSDAAGSFCAGCLAGIGRAAATRRAAFLRRKYAIRRLRFTRTLCCCPMESLWIENRRNAIGIETILPFQPSFMALAPFSSFRRRGDLRAYSQRPFGQTKRQSSPGRFSCAASKS